MNDIDIVDRLLDAVQIPGRGMLYEVANIIIDLRNGSKWLRAENERLRYALSMVMDDLVILAENGHIPTGMLDDTIYVNARAALKGDS